MTLVIDCKYLFIVDLQHDRTNLLRMTLNKPHTTFSVTFRTNRGRISPINRDIFADIL